MEERDRDTESSSTGLAIVDKNHDRSCDAPRLEPHVHVNLSNAGPVEERDKAGLVEERDSDTESSSTGFTIVGPTRLGNGRTCHAPECRGQEW